MALLVGLAKNPWSSIPPAPILQKWLRSPSAALNAAALTNIAHDDLELLRRWLVATMLLTPGSGSLVERLTNALTTALAT